MIDINKLIEVWITRKDKFKKADERAKRREDFFKEIKLIEDEEKDGLDLSIVRAKKNSAAQKLTGSGLVTYEFVDYYLKNPNFINFEIISPMVAFWDETIQKTYDSENKIIKIEIKPWTFRKELLFCFLACAFNFFMIWLTLHLASGTIKYLAYSLHLSESLIGLVYSILPLFFFCLVIFFGVLFLTLTDLKRLVK
ncbi:hypothetical protein [Acinetobacter higginsii]|uniref:hypothetical protein n=1 Tax=Acinetobacter higginsii TaxID=70347 RepID=UPI001F4A9958|nr:hypothetical protein [Acinetobacter higginsii]MCH7294100.1 hypothetical protein [Acinetobacter higginsii]